MASESLANRFANLINGSYYVHGIHGGIAGERELKNARVAGEISVYNGMRQIEVERIIEKARAASGRDDFYLCTWWPERDREKSRFWRVIIDEREV